MPRMLSSSRRRLDLLLRVRLLLPGEAAQDTASHAREQALLGGRLGLRRLLIVASDLGQGLAHPIAADSSLRGLGDLCAVVHALQRPLLVLENLCQRPAAQRNDFGDGTGVRLEVVVGLLQTLSQRKAPCRNATLAVAGEDKGRVLEFGEGQDVVLRPHLRIWDELLVRQRQPVRLRRARKRRHLAAKCAGPNGTHRTPSLPSRLGTMGGAWKHQA
mmetsp:Transcript_26816/g.71419  ORF Transcript_26816/g.71419 Transcript_26816/m.71419 type:complete len:216 (+) Transcript_26816:2-649(+)